MPDTCGCSGKAASLHSRMKEQCLIRADIHTNQPYFNFAKRLEEKRKDVDEEHRWELQLVDRSSSCGGSGKAASLHSTTINHILFR